MQQFVLVSSHDTAPVCDYLSLHHISVDMTRSPASSLSIFASTKQSKTGRLQWPESKGNLGRYCVQSMYMYDHHLSSNLPSLPHPHPANCIPCWTTDGMVQFSLCRSLSSWTLNSIFSLHNKRAKLGCVSPHHVNTLPSRVRAMENWLPHLTLATSALKLVIDFGALQLSLPPRPSLPKSPSPHDHTVPIRERRGSG